MISDYIFLINFVDIIRMKVNTFGVRNEYLRGTISDMLTSLHHLSHTELEH